MILLFQPSRVFSRLVGDFSIVARALISVHSGFSAIVSKKLVVCGRFSSFGLKERRLVN